MNLKIDDSIVKSVIYLISKEEVDKIPEIKRYLEQVSTGVSVDKPQVLIEVIKTKLYTALENKVKQELGDSLKEK